MLTPTKVNAQIKGRNQCSFIHLNIRSARSKEDELYVLFRDFAFNFDFIMLTETWYSNDTGILKTQGYTNCFLK